MPPFIKIIRPSNSQRWLLAMDMKKPMQHQFVLLLYRKVSADRWRKTF
jgi:hypothetical protein